MDLTLAGAGQHVFGPLPADLKERRGVTADESEEQRFAEGVELGLGRAEEALQHASEVLHCQLVITSGNSSYPGSNFVLK